MTVSIIVTQDPNRLNVAFHDGQSYGPVEGYIVPCDDQGGYLPFNLEGLPLSIEPLKPVAAGALVIENFAEREVEVIDRHIAVLEASRATATGLLARALPRRIEGSLRYREQVLAGEIG